MSDHRKLAKKIINDGKIDTKKLKKYGEKDGIDASLLKKLAKQAISDGRSNLQQSDPAAHSALMASGSATLADGSKLEVSPEEFARIQADSSLSVKERQDAVFESALRNRILNSGAISQQDAASCVGASVEYVLAKANPQAYSQIALDLNKFGLTVTSTGNMLSLSESSRQHIDSLPIPEEEKISLRFQTAAMESANGADSYDVWSGTSQGANGGYTGVSVQAAIDFNARFGIDTVPPAALAAAATAGIESGDSNQRIIAVIGDQLARAREDSIATVAVFLDAGENGQAHQVAVEDVGADGSVTYQDPATGRQVATGDAFAGMVAMDPTSVGHGSTSATTGPSRAGRR